MPGKRHLKSRERGDRKGANGGKREGERSEQESVVPRPPEREVHGEKTTERASCEVRLLSSRRSPKVGANGGENGLSASDYPLSSPSK